MKEYWAAFGVAVVAAMVAALVLMWPRLRRPPEAEAPMASSSAAPVTSRKRVPAASAPRRPKPSPGALCPIDMIHIEGVFCPFVAHRCAAYLGTEPDSSGAPEPEDEERRCQRYHDDLFCEGRPSELSFCVDRYEYPNLQGVKPAIMVSYDEAERACSREGKRLCEAAEWIFACEGDKSWPYPYGIERTTGTCNVDRRPLRPDEEALATPREVSVEVERLDQRVASGALAGCKSPFGVFDTTGNVAEWVHNREGDPEEEPYETVLAGGAWGRVRATCRRLDATHRADYQSVQTGFRCCRDPLDGRKARRLWPSTMRLPKRRKLLNKAVP